jgi:hypothetical protein
MNELNPKTLVFNHFQLRLKQRYNIDIRDKKGYLITCLPIQKLNKILIEKL